MFISIFKDEFDEFIKYKKSLGYFYRKETIIFSLISLSAI